MRAIDGEFGRNGHRKTRRDQDQDGKELTKHLEGTKAQELSKGRYLVRLMSIAGI